MAYNDRLKEIISNVQLLRELADSVIDSEMYPVSFFSRAYDLIQKLQSNFHTMEAEQVDIFAEQLKNHQALIFSIHQQMHNFSTQTPSILPADNPQDQPEDLQNLNFPQIANESPIPPELPSMQPEQPPVQPELPPIQPELPPVQPEQSPVQPEQPPVQPEQLPVQPEQPPVQPEKMQDPISSTAEVQERPARPTPAGATAIPPARPVPPVAPQERPTKPVPVGAVATPQARPVRPIPPEAPVARPVRPVPAAATGTQSQDPASIGIPSFLSSIGADISAEQNSSINQSFNHSPSDEPTINDAIEKQKVSDLRKAFSLNDRFRYRKELFNGSEEAMNKVIAILNDKPSFDESIGFLDQKLHWDLNDPTVKDFIKILELRF